MHITNGLFSHLYALMRVVPITQGPVLELGTGIGSTPYLHWACHPNRTLISYETSEKYYSLMKSHISTNHKIYLISDWDTADIERPWDVAFVDHSPNERRHVDVARLKDFAQYIVVHDVNPKYEDKYFYSKVYPLFKYQRIYQVARSWVAVLSNFVDVAGLPE